MFTAIALGVYVSRGSYPIGGASQNAAPFSRKGSDRVSPQPGEVDRPARQADQDITTSWQPWSQWLAAVPEQRPATPGAVSMLSPSAFVWSAEPPQILTQLRGATPPAGRAVPEPS